VLFFSAIVRHMSLPFRMLSGDPDHLESFIRSNCTLQSKMIQALCGSEDIFRKVKYAVHTLLRRIREQNFEVIPSAYKYDSSEEDRFDKLSYFILDHRANSCAHGLHVSLQVEAFGHFVDEMDSKACVDQKFCQLATSLMKKMNKQYSLELNRCSNFYNEVKEYFPSPKVSGKEFETDGTMSVCINDQQVHIINWEFKNELGSGGSDAVAQNNAYFVHLKKGESGRSPMLLVGVVGCHYFQVFGAAWNGGVVCVDPLCPPVSLLYVPHDPTSGILKTARVLAAMHFTVSKLTDYYSPPEDKQPQGPYFNSSGDLKSIKQFGESTRMFEAKLFDEDVIVKFSNFNYGFKVHNYLSQLKLAPRIKFWHKLAGKWLVIVMEKVNGSKLSLSASQDAKKAFKEAVERMHDAGFVHGNLHSDNILVDGDKICILGFDWAGVDGEARYPVELDSDRLHKGAQCGGLITKVHDLYQVKNNSR
jgi:hypothetical protein